MPADRDHLRALFHQGGFRRLLGVRLTSQFSDGLFQAALGGSLLFNPAQQTSPLKIAIGFAVLLVPFSVLGPYAGVFLDRWSRRNVIYGANLIRGAIAVPAAIFVAVSGPNLLFLACALVISAVNRFFLAGLSASLPHVVPEPLLVTGNAASSTLGTVAYSLGLATTTVGLHTVIDTNNTGYAWLAGAGAAGYLIASLLGRVSFAVDALGPDVRAVREGTPWAEVAMIARGMVEGLGHLAARPRVAYALGLQACNRMLYGVLTLATLLLYSRYFFHDYTAAVGGLAKVVIAGSAGAIIAAFVTPAATRRVGGRRWIIGCTLLLAVALPVLVLPFVPLLLVAATLVGNVSSQGIKILVDTNLQVHCAENFRGRVFSVQDTLFNLMLVVGLFIGALTLPPDGRSATAVVAIAVGYLVVATAYAWLTRNHPPLEAVPVAETPVAHPTVTVDHRTESPHG